MLNHVNNDAPRLGGFILTDQCAGFFLAEAEALCWM